MNTKILVFILSFSAILLSMLLIQRVFMSEEVFADSTTRGGDYILTTAASTTDEDMLWIANIRTRQLIVCERDSRSRITVLDTVDLGEVFGPIR